MKTLSESITRWAREHVNPMQKPNWNRVHYRAGFTPATMKTTQAIAYWLWTEGIDFATELKLKNGLRPDFVAPDLGGTPVIEILDSETEKMYAENKKAWYDKDGITVIRVPADPERAIKLIKEANGLR